MEVRFADERLDRLETDRTYDAGFSQSIVTAFRKRMQLIRAAPDERVFYLLKSLHFEKLQGRRSHQHSMRLNDQWRLIIELVAAAPQKMVVIDSIEDYHEEGTMSERIPAEVFPPGDFIKEELEAREWTQADLAEILGRPPRLVSEIINGKRAISPETAKGLGDAFGTAAQFWMNLESAYQLAQVKDQNDVVARRARLYSKAPVKEMLKRRWIEPSTSIDVLEKQIVDFF